MRSVLVMTYYWPPAGGPGVQRVLRLVRHLPEFGWNPIIVTVADGQYPAIDESLSEYVPGEFAVHRTRAREPFAAYNWLAGRALSARLPTFEMNDGARQTFRERLSRWVRVNLFVPDARVGWIGPAVRTGSRLLTSHRVDLIFSSSPPHSVQLAAMAPGAPPSSQVGGRFP